MATKKERRDSGVDMMTNNLSTRTLPSKPRGVSGSIHRLNKKEKKKSNLTFQTIDKIQKILEEVDIELSYKDRSELFKMIYNNDVEFSTKMLEKIGIMVEDYETHMRFMELGEYGRAEINKGNVIPFPSSDPNERPAAVYEVVDSGNAMEIDRAILKLNRGIQAYLKRLATGLDVFMWFRHMRTVDESVRFAYMAQFQTHIQLGRMVRLLDEIEQREDKKILGGMSYHMVIDSVHYDYVPLETGDLPLEWTLAVKIPECECSVPNWSKGPFVGDEWL